MPAETLITLITLTFTVVCAIGLLCGVRRLPVARKFRNANDVIGFYTTIIGTVYAVILAFMLFAVWTRYQDAQTTVEKEAGAVTDQFQLADGLPEPAQSQVRVLLRDYTQSVIRFEWPAMLQQHYSPRVTDDRNALWRILTHFEARTPRDQTVQDQMLTRLQEMNMQRRERLLTSRIGLPAILWIVLICGGILTVGSCALFGVEPYSLHVCKTLILAGIIYLVLYAVWLINGPFSGNVHIGHEAFDLALRTMDRLVNRS